jgi:hypothetical protein
MLLSTGFVFFLGFFFFFFFFFFCSLFVTCLNNDCPNHWIVNMNSFIAFGLRKISFSMRFSTPEVEEYELPMH